jgi:quercetin dioxygenase-like cupin family protein
LLSGTLEVEIEGGKKNRFTAGQALVETVNQKHNGRNIGKDPVKIVLFVMGEKDKPFTIK